LWRIVAARDGGICRIKLPGGLLLADQAEAVADAAERFAGGVIEATNRANLQIRGIGSHRGLVETCWRRAWARARRPATMCAT
jgi:precorrin-3B synthase